MRHGKEAPYLEMLYAMARPPSGKAGLVQHRSSRAIILTSEPLWSGKFEAGKCEKLATWLYNTRLLHQNVLQHRKLSEAEKKLPGQIRCTTCYLKWHMSSIRTTTTSVCHEGSLETSLLEL
ncbi:hypothetical protein HN51_019763 [Arachis hypogaea]